MLPNGFNVYPEDIENALRIAGLRDSVASRRRPAGSRRSCSRQASTACHARTRRRRRTTRQRSAHGRRRGPRGERTLGPQQRIAGWRLWPEDDFPRTHTLKVKRDLRARWVGEDAAAAVR